VTGDRRQAIHPFTSSVSGRPGKFSGGNRGGTDADQGISGPKDRNWCFFINQLLDSTAEVHPNCFHFLSLQPEAGLLRFNGPALIFLSE
jgi:hypothetical protein